jgi:hypothetical protein
MSGTKCYDWNAVNGIKHPNHAFDTSPAILFEPSSPQQPPLLCVCVCVYIHLKSEVYIHLGWSH